MNHSIDGVPAASGQHPINQKTAAQERAALKRVAVEFESLLLNELLKSMRSAESMIVGDEEKSPGSDLHREMMDEQLARAMARGGGLGLAKMLEEQLRQRHGEESP